MSSSPSSCFQHTAISFDVSGPVMIHRALVAGSVHPATTQKDVAAIGLSSLTRGTLRNGWGLRVGRDQPGSLAVPALTSPPMSERLDTWMDQYVLAWSSNETDHIETLFTEDAVYDAQTEGGEWEGLSDIVREWQAIADDEDNWDFQWQPVVETEAIAVIKGRTNYFDPPTSYRNLFVIRFAEDGRCYDFTEWYIEEAIE